MDPKIFKPHPGAVVAQDCEYDELNSHDYVVLNGRVKLSRDIIWMGMT